MESPDPVIHPTAQVDPSAQLDSGVQIGPFCIVGPRVSISKNTRLDAHIYLDGIVEIGEENHFFPYSSIGADPQDVTYNQEPTRVKIGDRNIFREFMTINRGTVKEEELTEIGSDNYFMAYSHIAHDCRIGDHVVFINAVTLGGHCCVDDYVQLGGLTGVHPFCRIGKYAFAGGGTIITHDVLPFCKIAGARPPLIYGPNSIGLRRLGFSRERLKTIKEIYRIIFFLDLNTAQAVERIETEIPPGEDRDEILTFVRSSGRGIVKKLSEEWKKDSV
jgi:UDP-N-acetylglucosamine acyltransferase